MYCWRIIIQYVYTACHIIHVLDFRDCLGNRFSVPVGRMFLPESHKKAFRKTQDI